MCGRRHGGSKAIPRQFYDVGMAALIAYLRWLCGNARFTPLCIEFVHAEPIDTEEYARILNCPIRFNSSHFFPFFRCDPTGLSFEHRRCGLGKHARAFLPSSDCMSRTPN
ncbi:AraC family transcriptional regulator ligand-binding domain-containing protein [Azotobacter vinelandii]